MEALRRQLNAIESSEVELDVPVVNAGEKKRRQKETTKTRKKRKLETERSKCDAAKLNPKEEPGPIITPDGDELYVVEKILSKEVGDDGVTYYEVKWEGWDNPEDITWEPLANLARCPELLLAFEMNSDSDKAKETVEESGEQSDQQQDDEAEVEALGVTTPACDDAALEALEDQAMGGMFRRVWRKKKFLLMSWELQQWGWQFDAPCKDQNKR
ncbi:M-phase phosphoprotein 8 [Orchesella cincta]|uniref:M-phase phosphoprotein 8 n=1 Tax=Orchesella cincta TaxID=48709 RepID=A0A1D2M4I4_ORCCI|nr:M-phase phosphoprotein 8 [Orchesella cincta]